MRKSLAASLLVVLLSVPAFAGDVNSPPAPAPPPCTENCTTGSASTAGTLEAVVLALLLILIRK